MLNIVCKTCNKIAGTVFYISNSFQSKTIIMGGIKDNKNMCECKKDERDWGKVEDIFR